MSTESVRKRLEAATPGPWFDTSYGSIQSAALVQHNNDVEAAIPEDAPADDPRWDDSNFVDVGVCGDRRWRGKTHPDAAFIAHARTDLELALEVIEAATKYHDRGHTGIKWPCWVCDVLARWEAAP